MRRSTVTRVLAAASVLVFPAAASADKTPPKALIGEKATLVSPNEIILEVKLKCEEGQSYGLFSDVLQEQWGVGGTSGQCTGHSQAVVITVYNPFGWQEGDAQAFLNVSTSTDFQMEARPIQIVL